MASPEQSASDTQRERASNIAPQPGPRKPCVQSDPGLQSSCVRQRREGAGSPFLQIAALAPAWFPLRPPVTCEAPPPPFPARAVTASSAPPSSFPDAPPPPLPVVPPSPPLWAPVSP